VISWFQSYAFTFNLYRYSEELLDELDEAFTMRHNMKKQSVKLFRKVGGSTTLIQLTHGLKPPGFNA
jgi:hypothetical protein